MIEIYSELPQCYSCTSTVIAYVHTVLNGYYYCYECRNDYVAAGIDRYRFKPYDPGQ